MSHPKTRHQPLTIKNRRSDENGMTVQPARVDIRNRTPKQGQDSRNVWAYRR